MKTNLAQPRMLRTVVLLSFLLVSVLPAFAQWTNQTILLRPGWNAVFLEIQPEPRTCDALFAGVPVESVWAWNRRFTPIQFIQDPSELIPGQPDWLTYLPPSHAGRGTMNLFTLLGHRAYLIKLPDNASPVSWTFPGRPVARRMEWLPDSFNFTGFAVDPVTPPTFQSFFAASPAHAGQRVYRLVNGLWSQVLSPTVNRLARGEAYWIFCRGQSTYAGPLEVAFEQGDGLNYGRVLTEQTLTIRNKSSTTNTISLRRLGSAQPSSGTSPALAGAVPLNYFRLNLVPSLDARWIPLPSPLSVVLGPGQEWNVRLEAQRAAMAPFTPPPGVTDVLYQSLLEVSDGAGSRQLVGVTAGGLQTFASSAGGNGAFALSAVPGPVHLRAGLWVGMAAINKVNQPANPGGPTVPTPTASDFQFRLLVHVDDSGQARLLQKVVQMWKDGTFVTDTNGLQVVAQPGRYVLVTEDRFLPAFSGATMRDGEPVGRRVSSSAFGFRSPIPMTGDFGSTNGLLRCSVGLEHDDGLNPFNHRFHPDHDNLDENVPPRPLSLRTNAHGLRYTAESSSVRRDISLQFTAVDPDRLAIAGWGDDQLGGIYRETMTGLHKDALQVEGVFRLQHASRVGVLNDGRQ
jgi:hypothetical protein